MSTEERIVNSLLDKLFRQHMLFIKSDTRALIGKNNKLQREDYTGFSYKGVQYGAEQSSWAERIPLAEVYHVDLDNLLLEEIKLKDRMNKTHSYLSRAFTLIENSADIKALLPEQIHQYLNVHTYGFTTLSPEQVMEFNTNNIQYVDIIKEQMITNLLLK